MTFMSEVGDVVMYGVYSWMEPSQPTYDEIYEARWNARCLRTDLIHWQTRMLQYWPQNVEATSTARLIDQVLQALQDDHGGDYPDKVLEWWQRERSDFKHDKKIFTTSDEKQAMVKIWKRWYEKDWIKKAFWCLDIYDRFFVRRDHLPQVKQCLLEWLQKHRAGELYPEDEAKLD